LQDVQKALQRGRSERIPEAYSLEYVEGLSDARTKLEGFLNILLRQVFGWRLRRLNDRLREEIPILATLLPLFFLAMGIEIFFRIRQMTFTDVVQPLLVEQERPFVVSGIFIHFRHRQGIDRTRLDAIAAEYALRNIDIKFTGKTLQWQRLIFRTDDLNAAGWTGRFAEIASDATFLPIVIPQEAERPPMRVRNRSLFPRVLKRNRAMKHVLECDLHRVPYFRKEGSLPDPLRKCPNAHMVLPWQEARGERRGAIWTSFTNVDVLPLTTCLLPIAFLYTFSMVAEVNLKYGTPV
jgi:hypothetical protein